MVHQQLALLSSLCVHIRSQYIHTWSTNVYIMIATTIWLYHEFLLSLAQERRCIWRRQFSAVTAVFFTTRYVTLLSQVLKIGQYILSSYGTLSCNVVMRADAVMTTILYANVTVFSSLRIYAISGRNVWLAFTVFGLGMIHVGFDAYTNNVGTFVPLPAPLSGCVQSVVPSECIFDSVILGGNQPLTKVYQFAAYAGSACIILSELVVQVYTWKKTLDMWQTLRSYNIQKPLYLLLLRDGSISYLILTVWSIVTRIVTRIDITAMALPGVSVLLCRFILSLRQVNLTNQGPDSSIASRIIGNAGAPLNVNIDDNARSMGEPAEDEDDGPVYVTDNPLMAGLGPDKTTSAKFDYSKA